MVACDRPRTLDRRSVDHDRRGPFLGAPVGDTGGRPARQRHPLVSTGGRRVHPWVRLRHPGDVVGRRSLSEGRVGRAAADQVAARRNEPPCRRLCGRGDVRRLQRSRLVGGIDRHSGDSGLDPLCRLAISPLRHRPDPVTDRVVRHRDRPPCRGVSAWTDRDDQFPPLGLLVVRGGFYSCRCRPLQSSAKTGSGGGGETIQPIALRRAKGDGAFLGIAAPGPRSGHGCERAGWGSFRRRCSRHRSAVWIRNDFGTMER